MADASGVHRGKARESTTADASMKNGQEKNFFLTNGINTAKILTGRLVSKKT